MKKTSIAIAVVATLLSSAGAFAAWAPDRPVEFVVASGAGGGTDNFARTIQSIITKDKLLDQPIVVLNKGAGSGAEAFVYAKTNPHDPQKLIFGTNNEYLLPEVAKMAYAPDNLVPVAALAFDEFLIWVKADAPYKTAADFIKAAKASPGSVTFGGSQSKDTDETLVALLEQKTGAKFKYVPFNGGGEVGVQLAGGHIAANVNNPNENLGQWQAGAIKPLCVFSQQPMAEGPAIQGNMGWHDIPTCVSSGIDISAYEMPRTVWLPAGVSDDQVAFYTDVLKKVSETPEWKAYVAKTSQTGRFMAGKELASFIENDASSATQVFKAEGWTAK